MVHFWETILEKCEAQDWNMVGRGFFEGFLEFKVV